MESQNCKVGAVTPLAEGKLGIAWLEIHYLHFQEKAAEVAPVDANLREFFEKKALKLQKMLQDLVSDQGSDRIADISA